LALHEAAGAQRWQPAGDYVALGVHVRDFIGGAVGQSRMRR